MSPKPDSILARLRHQGRVRGLEPQTMLLLYAQEGFLARLGQSPHAEHFVLKGGLSMYGRYQAEARPTRDIDLAGRGMPGTVEAVSTAITEIAEIELDDGLSFEAETLQAREISEDAIYGGIRVELWVRLGRSRERLQLDISFGNVITPGPVELFFPSLLGPAPHPVLGYPLESVVAEKLAAVTELGLDNTRMKDFYDVYWILSRETLEDGTLLTALRRTFTARGTDLEQLVPSLSALENPETERRWAQFRRNVRVEAPEQVAEVLQAILSRIRKVLEERLGD
jgi:predicted nucleotidyltransferase component of viral defense system